MCNIEYKKSIIESTLASAKLYYDDRVKNIELTTREAKAAASAAASQINNSNLVGNSANSGAGAASSALSGLKKKLSSKKRKDKRSSFQELKINEETDQKDDDDKQQQQLQQHEETNILNDDEVDNDIETDNDNENFIDLENSLTLSPNEIASHLVNKIDRKVQLLDRLWQELNRQSLNYNNILLNFYQNLQQLNKSFELVNQKLNENEQLVSKISNIGEIESEKLADELEKIKNFQLRMSTYQPLIDDMCTQYTNVMQELQHCGSISNGANTVQTATGTPISAQQAAVLAAFNTKFDDINLRWSNLQNQLQENYLHIYSLIESSGANIFLKLADSVQSPWQRGISSSNKVPYYIK